MDNKDFNNVNSLMDEIADLKKQLEIKTTENEYLREKLRIGGVVSSVPNKALKDSQLSDMVSGYKVMCKPDANFEKYYSKGFTECWEWIKRITK